MENTERHASRWMKNGWRDVFFASNAARAQNERKSHILGVKRRKNVIFNKKFIFSLYFFPIYKFYGR
jgi:hypothetical protein